MPLKKKSAKREPGKEYKFLPGKHVPPSCPPPAPPRQTTRASAQRSAASSAGREAQHLFPRHRSARGKCAGCLPALRLQISADKAVNKWADGIGSAGSRVQLTQRGTLFQTRGAVGRALCREAEAIPWWSRERGTRRPGGTGSAERDQASQSRRPSKCSPCDRGRDGGGVPHSQVAFYAV